MPQISHAKIPMKGHGVAPESTRNLQIPAEHLPHTSCSPTQQAKVQPNKFHGPDLTSNLTSVVRGLVDQPP